MTWLGWMLGLLRGSKKVHYFFFKDLYLAPVLTIVAGFVLFSPVQAQSQQTPAVEPDTTLTYEVNISGATDEILSEGGVMELLSQSSRLEQLKNKPPSSLAALKRRVREDEDNFDKVLRSEGFYDNKITFEVDETQNPIKISFLIDPGPLFHISKFDIRFMSGRLIPDALKLSDLGIAFGMVARSEDIVNAQNQAMLILADHGYPDAKIADQETVVDFATQKMETTLILNEGPRLVMGNLQFEGLKTVEASYLIKLARWKAGVLYNAKVIDELRRTYLHTGLFEAVHLKPRDENRNSGIAQVGAGVEPIILSFVERDHKSVGLGASFSTSEGAGTQFFWENRNVFGEGEKLRADLTVAEIRQQFKVGFVKPNYLRLDQSFHSDVNLRQENTEAYEEQSISVTAGVERKWRKNWIVGAGLSFELSEIQDEDDQGEDDTESFTFASLPLSARYDSTNDLLDPTKGFRFGTTTTPYLGLSGTSPNFLHAEIDGSTYYSVLKDNKLVLAARAKVGAIAGDSAGDIPATKRFYSGGGGSIRGYEHQTVGPLNSSDDPVGGRSLIEVGAEARIRITEDIGLVPFIEGGNVYDSVVPDFSENFQWGAGLGLRYYTAIGPIRLDVAVPLNRRKDIDDAFQFYISLGQAF